MGKAYIINRCIISYHSLVTNPSYPSLLLCSPTLLPFSHPPPLRGTDLRVLPVSPVEEGSAQGRGQEERSENRNLDTYNTLTEVKLQTVHSFLSTSITFYSILLLPNA